MPRRAGTLDDLYRYSGLGLQFAATIGVFALGGHGLDRWLGSTPLFLIVGVFSGFALGLYSMTKKLPTSRRPGPERSERDPR
jgi:F0F1-type ATP synthase assembly protein I